MLVCTWPLALLHPTLIDYHRGTDRHGIYWSDKGIYIESFAAYHCFPKAIIHLEYEPNTWPRGEFGYATSLVLTRSRR